MGRICANLVLLFFTDVGTRWHKCPSRPAPGRCTATTAVVVIIISIIPKKNGEGGRREDWGEESGLRLSLDEKHTITTRLRVTFHAGLFPSTFMREALAMWKPGRRMCFCFSSAQAWEIVWSCSSTKIPSSLLSMASSPRSCFC